MSDIHDLAVAVEAATVAFTACEKVESDVRPIVIKVWEQAAEERDRTAQEASDQLLAVLTRLTAGNSELAHRLLIYAIHASEDAQVERKLRDEAQAQVGLLERLAAPVAALLVPVAEAAASLRETIRNSRSSTVAQHRQLDDLLSATAAALYRQLSTNLSPAFTYRLVAKMAVLGRRDFP